MRSIVRWPAIVAAVAFASPVWAEDAPAAPSIDVTGFVDGYYSYNLNDPSDGVNGLHTFDVDHNSLDLAVAEVAFEKKPTADSRAGFRVDLNFGPNAELVNAFEPSGIDSLKNLQQAYVSWLPSDKLQLDFGKWVTGHGAEVIESKDNWNYTRSIQFGWAIPFYHAGLRAMYTASDKVTVGVHVVNGWNNVKDNNDDKSFGGQLIVKPTGKFTWIGNVMVGKEGGEDSDSRLLFDTVLSLTASDKLSLMGNFDYGKEGDAKWMAVSAYAKWQASDTVALAPRFEWMDDGDGWATIGTTVMSATLTGEVKLGNGVLTRLDVRHDFADEAGFTGDGDTLEDGQTTLTLGVVYAFGGKI